MVNRKEFAKRLTQVLEYYKISATALAEKMGIQRSSISHLLSERNKPSLDFVIKLLKIYPEVELYWLLYGEGTFPSLKKTKIKIEDPTLFSEIEEMKTAKVPTNLSDKINSPISSNEDEIEQIVVFYKNGSFKSYSQKELP